MLGYILTLFITVGFWLICCFFLRSSKAKAILAKTTLMNIVFAFIILICHLSSMIIIYLDVGFYDWNFQNTMPYANISPFMFVVAPLFLVLPKVIKKYCLGLISLLSVGMLIATLSGIIYNISINYKFHTHFLLNYGAHLLFSIWGICIVQSKQFELNLKNALISSAIMFSVPLTMIILNVILDKSFFGLSLNGKHNIYNIVLTKNSFASALIYFTGLAVILTLGYLLQLLLMHKKEQ